VQRTLKGERVPGPGGGGGAPIDNHTQAQRHTYEYTTRNGMDNMERSARSNAAMDGEYAYQGREEAGARQEREGEPARLRASGAGRGGSDRDG
jgi:hypothetical protein